MTRSFPFAADESELDSNASFLIASEIPKYTTNLLAIIARGSLAKKLSAYAKALYIYVVSWQDAHGICDQTAREISENANISFGSLIRAKQELAKHGLLRISKSQTGRDVLVARAPWRDNIDEFEHEIVHLVKHVSAERSRVDHDDPEWITRMPGKMHQLVERSRVDQQGDGALDPVDTLILGINNNTISKEIEDISPSEIKEKKEIHLTNSYKEKKENESSNSRSIHRNPWTKHDIERIYKTYPRHVGRAKALAKIQLALQEISKRSEIDAPAEWLLERVEKFAMTPKGQAGDGCPHPATWFGQGRYDDDDKEWQIVEGLDRQQKQRQVLMTYQEAMQDWTRLGSPGRFDSHYKPVKQRDGEKPMWEKI